jgi:ferredoxin--NADP+ reductase
VSETPAPRHCVAVIGGACAGAEAVETLAARGIHCVVFEQNDRPYGKIEDGLPRWHDKQRQQEYRKLDGKIGRPGVDFVPRTRIGRDIAFADLAREWGFSAVLLANGSWRDRPAGVPGADENLGRGFAYQNPFIYWFNHHEEPGYRGPQVEIHEGAYVLGGGLASIDVVKVFMLESVAARLRARGIEVDVVEMEHAGVGETLKAHGLTVETLGVAPPTLVYRRSIREMPVASPRDGAGPEEKARVEGVREKLIAASTAKFGYRVLANRVAKRIVAEGGRVTGLVLARTETKDGKLVEVPGSEETLPTRAVVSSVGSIPEPIEGIPMKGELYVYTDWNTGQLDGYEGVFALGNVITGKGNIAVSRKHGKQIADWVIAHYLGVGGAGREEAMATVAAAAADARHQQAEAVARAVASRPALAPSAFDGIRRRVAERQAAVGFRDYASWIAAHGAGASS